MDSFPKPVRSRKEKWSFHAFISCKTHNLAGKRIRKGEYEILNGRAS